MAQNACVWTEDFNAKWDTSCGEAYCFIDGSPTTNGLRFCGYCGKPLEEEPYQDPAIPDEDDEETA